MTTAEVLRAAKALIDSPEKWGKGRGLQSPSGCLCLSDAVYRAAAKAYTEYAPALDALRGVGGYSVPVYQWNDRPGTTHSDVLSLLDNAIAACEAS